MKSSLAVIHLLVLPYIYGIPTADGGSPAVASVSERERFFLFNDFVRTFSVILISMNCFSQTAAHDFPDFANSELQALDVGATVTSQSGDTPSAITTTTTGSY